MHLVFIQSGGPASRCVEHGLHRVMDTKTMCDLMRIRLQTIYGGSNMLRSPAHHCCTAMTQAYVVIDMH